MMTKSWKTSLAGIAAVGVVLFAALEMQFDNNPLTVPNWGAVVGAMIAGVGLLFARDNDVSSESAGAK
jgi:hypothetical protein